MSSEGSPEGADEANGPRAPYTEATGVGQTWKNRAFELAKTGAPDGTVLAALRHEARGKWPLEELRRGFKRWVRQGWIEDARAAGSLEIDEALRKAAQGEGNQAATSAIYLAKREDIFAGMDPELRKLLKELKGLSGKDLKKRAAAALGELDET